MAARYSGAMVSEPAKNLLGAPFDFNALGDPASALAVAWRRSWSTDLAFHPVQLHRLSPIIFWSHLTGRDVGDVREPVER